MTVDRYAELHCVSNFSFLRGASHPGELVYQAHNLGYSALALTDECSMAGVVRALEAAEDCGLQLIVGAEFRCPNDLHLVLLAPSQRAYAQICQLITKGRIDSAKGTYQLARGDLEKDLSECLALWVAPRNARPSEARWLREFFPDRGWIAVPMLRRPDDSEHLAAMQRLGQSFGLPLVASGDVHMHIESRRALQDTMTAIRQGCTVRDAGHRLFPNGERHLRPRHVLAELYPRELLEETLRIAERCKFSLRSLQYHYPNEIVPAGRTATQHLRDLTELGIRRRWPKGEPASVRATIEKELALIERKHYEHFFLTVHEITEWARSELADDGGRKKPILCQGRGSAANSIVCYALGITEVNPEDISVLFERFLSDERDEPPDIDVDFEHERREEVIQHVFRKYGRARAAIAATVITYQPRSAIREVGKALGLTEDVVGRLAKSHAWWDNWERLSANIQAMGMHVDDIVMRRLCTLVKDLLNFPRHLSQHVGGFVIAEEPISELVPIENAAMPDRTIIQWDKNDLEELGLLKVDVLALGMLTAMRKTFELLETAGTGPTAMDQIARGDEATYDMICRADTIGVFQIESRAQMSMLPRLKPRTYYDLVIEIAIVRPGPIKGGMVHPYLQRRSMRDEDIPYASDALRPVLAKTRGVPIFQEQVMQIAIVAASFTPGEADQLRRAMGAWQRSGKMSMYRDKLMSGMLANGYTPEFAEQIYKQIEGFGEYGFPESHSASFALLTYFSSWLKCHRPAAFIAGLINSQPMGFYQPSQLLEQAKRQGVKVLPVDVTVSDYDCTLEPDEHGNHAIRLGMRLVKGLRREEAMSVVAARASAPFTSVEDVAYRAGLKSRAAKALAQSGGFRSLSEHRNHAFWSALGIEHLPGALAANAAREPAPALPVPTEWEEVQRDYRQMGLSTGRHPMAVLRPKLRASGISTRSELDRMRNGRTVRVGGLVTHLQHPQTANGVIFASLEDETGINNIVFWPGVFEAYRDRILQSNFMVVTGEVQSLESVVHVVAMAVEDYSHWVRTLPRKSRDFH
ncbi:error-prone DNA polymerase [Steroidobacter sp. S1-65]|uniref:Error-prone DNA polymerase n=1 Tax=Steroidobacter gossypii TaxID=2805490 RepID=A0ABS1X426_9GAMM|nr:error-prone DNA polymerase [Steroidobacter gossypii]MBM0107978.1 error-prone DNA polymerase [Steroidobacter gossypii]